MHFNIKNIEVGKNRCFIMAEIASSHCGSPELLRKIFLNSVKANVDAVKVQVFDAWELCSKNNPDYKILKSIEISPEEWKKMFQEFSAVNTIIFAEVFDEMSLELAAPYVDGLSLHSTDLTNPRMLKLAAEKGKPLILNVGGSTLEEIKNAVSFVEQLGNKQIILIYGIQNFPTRTDRINLDRIKKLQQEFPYPVGYHDHTESTDPLAISLPIAAFARGAKIIEKHVTNDREQKGFDYISSLNEEELTSLVRQIREIESSFGKAQLDLCEEDWSYRKKMKKYIVAKENLKAGTLLVDSLLAYKRTQKGLLPSEREKVINRKLLEDVEKDQIIEERCVE